MHIRGIAHIGLAVKNENWEQQLAFYQDVLNLKLLSIHEITQQQVRAALFQVGEGAVTIELLTPLSSDSPISQFLAKRGEGFHHLAYSVDNVREALTTLQSAGVTLINDKLSQGVTGKLVAFLHPRSTFGLLT